jgi:hypothetical protein
VPANVSVWLDGVKQFDYDVDHRRLLVRWEGVHVVEFRNDECCEKFWTEIGPHKTSKFVDGDRIIGVLARKPGFLTVKMPPVPADALIEVRELDDSPRAMKPVPAKNGETVTIPFDATGELRKRVQVSVYLGDKTVKKSDVVVIAPGEKRSVSVPLD